MKAEEFHDQVVQALSIELSAEQRQKIRFLCEKYAVENAYTETLRTHVRLTRNAQKKYFKQRDPVNLQKVKEQERMLDQLAAIEPKEIRYEQKSLFK